jgi:hypothetical protein
MTNILHCLWIDSKYLSIILFTILISSTLPSHGQKFENCGESCFRSEIISLEESEAGCLDYEIKVTYEGRCTAALSHYTLDMSCGFFSEASNSAGWPIILNETDPTSGLTGLKVDNIAEFGDENPLESFTLKFTFCPTDCEEEKNCFNPTIAYKASTCIYTETVDAQCIKPLSIQANPTNLACNSAEDGSVTLEIAGGQEPYQVDWNHGVSGATITELTAGVYTYTVTSADGQTLSDDVIIYSPEAITINSSITQPSCDGNTRGAISLSIVGGVGPYTYQWSNGSTESNLDNLSAGTYSITIADENGCSISESFEIIAPSPVEIDAEVTQPDCENSFGSITLNTHSEEIYTYLWSDGSTEEVRSGLAAGIYSVLISNDQGCQVEKDFEITAAIGSLAVSSDIVHPTCQQANGGVEVVVSGGVSPYTYQWAHGGEDAAINDLAAGNYTVTVTDANGCSTSESFSLVAQNNIYLSARETNTNCQNEPIGAIDLRVIGGTAPYTYEWSTGETTEDIAGLTEGTYTVKVTDAVGCSRTLIKRIRQNTFYLSGSTQNKICDTPGSIDLTLYYAEEPISYTWSNGSTTEDIDNLSPGQYSVTVVDGRGCEVSRSFNIYESNNLNLTFNPTVQGCGEQTTYSLEGSAVGGTAPFSYVWGDGTEGSMLENIQPGTYELTVSDANGCSRTASYTVEAQVGNADCLIQASATSLSCGTSNNVLSTNITDAQSYQWSVTSSDQLWIIDAGADSGEISFTAGGENSTATFSLQITTAEGCVAQCTYTINSCTPSNSNDPTDGNDSDQGDSSDNTGDDSTDDGSDNSDEGTDDGSDSNDGTDNTGDETDSGDGTDTTDGNGTDSDTDDSNGEDGTNNNNDTPDNDESDNGDNPEDEESDNSGDDSNEDSPNDHDDSETGGDGSDSPDKGNSSDDGNNSGEEENGEDDANGDKGNDQSCIDCFNAQAVVATVVDQMYQYTIKVSSDLTCNFDLSNLVIALPECATLESYSNSEGWRMEKVYTDKNTGLTGIKVDNIPSFGKDASFTEFTINLSLSTYSAECQELLDCWSPQVAFKAGQCVTKEAVSQQCVPTSLNLTAYPNPAAESVRIDVADLNTDEEYSVEIFDTQGTPLKKIARLSVTDLADLAISLDEIKSTFVYLKVNGSSGSSWSAKIMISQ